MPLQMEYFIDNIGTWRLAAYSVHQFLYWT